MNLTTQQQAEAEIVEALRSHPDLTEAVRAQLVRMGNPSEVPTNLCDLLAIEIEHRGEATGMQSRHRAIDMLRQAWQANEAEGRRQLANAEALAMAPTVERLRSVKALVARCREQATPVPPDELLSALDGLTEAVAVALGVNLEELETVHEF
ncbi:MAG TPA: hypothetical protein VFT74_11735 [Isosphaeraceae bacterium]|nr:hypothetical protein [Isosphaeraceae bacterium]